MSMGDPDWFATLDDVAFKEAIEDVLSIAYDDFPPGVRRALAEERWAIVTSAMVLRAARVLAISPSDHPARVGVVKLGTVRFDTDDSAPTYTLVAVGPTSEMGPEAPSTLEEARAVIGVLRMELARKPKRWTPTASSYIRREKAP